MPSFSLFTTYSFYRVANVLVALLVTVTISRLIGVEGFGVFTILIVNATFFNLLSSFGASAGVAYYAASDEVRPQTLVRYIWMLLVGQLLLLVLTEGIHYYVTGKLWLLSASAFKGLWVALLYTASVSLNEKYNLLLNGRQMFVLPLKIIFLSNLLLIILLLISSFYNDTSKLLFYLGCFVVMHTVQTICMILAWHFKQGSIVPTPEPQRESEFRMFFSYSRIVFFTNLIQYCAYKADIWILSYYNGVSSDVGLYSLASRLGQVYWILPGVLANVLLVESAKARENDDGIRVGRIIRIMNTANLGIGVLLFLLAGLIVPLIFGNAYTGSVELLLLQLPGCIGFCNTVVLAAFFAGKKKLSINLKGSVLCCLLNVLLCSILVPVAGAHGAAIGVSMGFIMTSLFMLYRYAQYSGVPLKKMLLCNRRDWQAFKFRALPFLNKTRR